MSIKYFIRTTLERKLDASISRELEEDYTLLIDTEHKPVESFIEQLETISNYDSVLLEDDVILCKDFKSRVEEVISEYPGEIVQLFSRPNRYFQTYYSDVFAFNQCTYYPKGIGKLIADEMKNLKLNIGYDSLENIALRKLGLKHLQYRPCLVQHIDNGSLMDHNCKFSRRSPYFIDYLDELGISYEDAGSSINTKKLIGLMNQKFEEIVSK